MNKRPDVFRMLGNGYSDDYIFRTLWDVRKHVLKAWILEWRQGMRRANPVKSR